MASWPDCKKETMRSLFWEGDAKQTSFWVDQKHNHKEVLSFLFSGRPKQSQVVLEHLFGETKKETTKSFYSFFGGAQKRNNKVFYLKNTKPFIARAWNVNAV